MQFPILDYKHSQMRTLPPKVRDSEIFPGPFGKALALRGGRRKEDKNKTLPAASKKGSGGKNCADIAEEALEQIAQNGISVFCGGTKACGLAAPRKQEILAMIFRYRG